MKKLLPLILFFFIVPIYATSYTDLYVDTDVGDDGNDCTSVGVDNACASLSGAVAKLEENDEDVTIHCKGAAADTTAVTISLTHMDGTHTLTIQTDAADRFPGKWSTDHYRLVSSSAYVITINYGFLNIDGLQIDGTYEAGAIPHVIHIDLDPSFNPALVQISNFMLKKSAHRSDAGEEIGIIWIADGSVTNGVLNIWNGVIYDLTNGHANTSGIWNAEGDVTANIYNMTFHNNQRAVVRGGGTVNIVNGLFDNNAADAAGTVSDTYCITTNDNTKGLNGAGAGNQFEKTFVFEDDDNEDFHLDATDTDAIDQGITNPGSGLFLDDVDGTARAGYAPWDVGADEEESTPVSTRGGDILLLGVG